MHAVFDQIEPLFNQFKNRANTEFEIRLGKKTRQGFDTDVGKETFEKILHRLEKYNGWESVKKTNETVYFKGDLRVSDNEDTGETKAECKKKLTKHDVSLDNCQYDVRFCVSSETPCEKPDDTVYDDMRVKKRVSFIRKNLSIDMTHVSGDVDDPDSENVDKYEIEFEIIHPQKVADKDTLYNLIYKIHDVLKLSV
jgi:hypothetical protein